ncbi:MAG: 2-hydroxyacyl-CoA dehydratase family protein [Alphaproteobacteria bacterium]
MASNTPASSPVSFDDPRDIWPAAERMARDHIAVGGRVCGYLGIVPVEMIAAAGFLPMQLSAGDISETPLADHYMEDLFDPVVRGVFERLLKGEFDWLSAIVLPRAGDSVHRLYYYLCEIGRVGAARLPPLLLADVVQTTGQPSDAYNTGRIAHFWDQLGADGNHRAGDAELVAAIARSNQLRVQLGAVVRKRRNGGLSGGHALAAFAAARMLPDAAVRRAIAAATDMTNSVESSRPRIVICGNAHDDAGLHGAIERAGGLVVGDFHGAGELSIGAMIDETLRPLEALRRHYQAGVIGSRSVGDAAATLATFASEAGADAVIFSYFPVEEALSWDFPEQVAALDRINVATLRLGDQARPCVVSSADVAAIAGLISRLRERKLT